MANKWGKEPWEVGLFPDDVTPHEKLIWRLRWAEWQRVRAVWRSKQTSIEIVNAELMING